MRALNKYKLAVKEVDAWRDCVRATGGGGGGGGGGGAAPQNAHNSPAHPTSQVSWRSENGGGGDTAFRVRSRPCSGVRAHFEQFVALPREILRNSNRLAYWWGPRTVVSVCENPIWFVLTGRPKRRGFTLGQSVHFGSKSFGAEMSHGFSGDIFLFFAEFF